jgi:hypothetical protein
MQGNRFEIRPYGAGTYKSNRNMQGDIFEKRPYGVGTYEVGSTSSSTRQSHAALTLVTLACGFVSLSLCVAAIIWLWVSGPLEVPGQDTRITAAIISVGRSLASLFIGISLARAAWGAFIPQLVDGSRFSARTLLAVCHNWDSPGQWQDFRDLPTSFKIYVLLGVLTWIGMTGTSSTFRYVSHGVSATGTALVADFTYACNTSLVQPSPNYTCQAATSPNTTDINTSFNLNGNTTRTSWGYIEQVNSGGRGTVNLTGSIGDDALGANVTVAVLPDGWYLKEGHKLPWMAISVSCQSLPIAAEFTGTGLLANATIIVDGWVIDYLDVSEMPQWNGLVHMYQQVNDSGPFSSLSPWKIVMLTRDVYDGTAHFDGLADDAVTYLGDSYVDLHGLPQPVLQGILGAAAYCEFEGSAGGGWPDDLWPARGQTTNFVAGELVDNRPTMATGVLNYGPSWQYSPAAESFLEGGTVSYIANNTGPGVSFPDLFASYMRNQWALMAYSMSPQCSQDIETDFEGVTSSRLFINVTAIAVMPLSALVLGLFTTLVAFYVTLRQRYWVQRVEFEGWWLFKALRPDLRDVADGDATRKELQTAYNGLGVAFDSSTGQLEFRHEYDPYQLQTR